MVFVGDFNKEITGLFKSKYPTEKEKLLELNLSSINKNPSFNYNISSLYQLKNENKLKCCEGENACCGENNKNINNINNNVNNKLFTLDGSSTLKWDMFSTQMETKIDMNGISIMEAKTLPYYGLSLTSKYERSSKNLGSGSLEIGGDIQKECFQSRFRVSPSIESLGCVNKLNKENKDSIGMMLSNTINMKPFSFINSNLSFGTMISSSNINLPYNKNSIKIVMGLMFKGPLCIRKSLKEHEYISQIKETGLTENQYNFNKKKESFSSRFKNNVNYIDNDNNDNTKIKESFSSYNPNYILSIQTNTNNHNKLSGFTGGLLLNNLVKNYLTLGVMISYNALNIIGRNDQNNNLIISDNKIDSFNKCSKAYENLTKFSEKVQYTIGGKISFGSLDNNYNLFGKTLCLNSECSNNNNLDENIKSTDLRFKIMNNLKMAYSLTHRFTKNISATFGAQVDPKKLDNPDSIKYGFILDISA